MEAEREKELVVVSAKVRPELLEQLDYIAAKADITRGQLVRNILEQQVEAVLLSDKLGIFQMSVLLRDLGEDIKAWVNAVREEPQYVGRATA